MKKTLTISATALAAVIALAGCSTGPAGGSSMPGMDHSTMGSSAAPAAADHNGSDTMFAQGMIPHHAQAVEMSDIILKSRASTPGSPPWRRRSRPPRRPRSRR